MNKKHYRIEKKIINFVEKITPMDVDTLNAIVSGLVSSLALVNTSVIAVAVKQHSETDIESETEYFCKFVAETLKEECEVLALKLKDDVLKNKAE